MLPHVTNCCVTKQLHVLPSTPSLGNRSSSRPESRLLHVHGLCSAPARVLPVKLIAWTKHTPPESSSQARLETRTSRLKSSSELVLEWNCGAKLWPAKFAKSCGIATARVAGGYHCHVPAELKQGMVHALWSKYLRSSCSLLFVASRRGVLEAVLKGTL